MRNPLLLALIRISVEIPIPISEGEICVSACLLYALNPLCESVSFFFNDALVTWVITLIPILLIVIYNLLVILISKRENFYQQEYCGCVFSLRDTNEWRTSKGRKEIEIGKNFYGTEAGEESNS